MVDYDLTFPVQGLATFYDTFYAARGSGQHHAQDLMSKKLIPVVAAASGTVRYVNYSRDPENLNPDRCCTLVLDHDDDWATWYLHLNNDTPDTDDGQGWGVAPGIEPGVHVEAGRAIGWVGDSGNGEHIAAPALRVIRPRGCFGQSVSRPQGSTGHRERQNARDTSWWPRIGRPVTGPLVSR